MAKSYKPRRHKLKMHDAGRERHNTPLEQVQKRRRLEIERSALSRKKGRKQQIQRRSKFGGDAL